MSYWGPITGFVISQGVGMLWYSSLLFGPRWMKIVYPGKTAEELGATSGKSMVVSMAAHAALAGFLNHLYTFRMGVDCMHTAIMTGVAFSGVGALSEICHVMFGNKPWALFFIDHGFNSVVIMVMSASIGFFQ